MYPLPNNQVIISKKSDDSDLRYQTSIVGNKPGKFILIDNPLVNGLPLFKVGDKVVIRYLAEGIVFGFESGIISVINTPCTLAFLDIPSSIEEKSLRRSSRINTFLFGKITFSGTDILGAEKLKTKEVMILNLSSEGCMISVSEDFSQGEKVQLNFDLPNGKKVQISNCVVRRIEKSKKDFFYGVEFVNLDLDSKTSIEEFVELCRSYPNR